MTIVATTGRITAMNHVTFIGACASADLQVLTAGFANPAMTFTVQGDAALRNQTLIGTTTFTTWRAGNGASGEITITAGSVERTSVTASTTFRVDPFVAAYGGGSSGSAFVVRGVDAGLADNMYRLALSSNASATGIYIVTANGNTLSGTAANGNTISVNITPTAMQGTVVHANGTSPVVLSHNCAP